ncbi:MAG: DUF2670 domain-containing protein, partial [Rickettsia aeschlimannii]
LTPKQADSAADAERPIINPYEELENPNNLNNTPSGSNNNR